RLHTLAGVCLPLQEVVDAREVATGYNIRVADYHTYFVGAAHWQFAVWTHNTNSGPTRAPGTLSGPVSFWRNFLSKVRKHIDQVRNRGAEQEAIPSPGRGGADRVRQIIQDRVAQGGGRDTTYAGEPAVAFEDGGVTYIFRPNGEFWTILGN